MTTVPLIRRQAAMTLLALAAMAGLLAGCGQDSKGKHMDIESQKAEDIEWQAGADRPPTTRTLLAMARLLADQDRDAEAAFVLKRVLEENPRYLPAYVDLAEVQVRRGEIQALIGPNGSGKTTILNMLSGLYVPTAGEIVLEGAPITGQKPHIITAHGVARTFQNIRLFGELTVLDNVLIGQHSRSRAGLVASVLHPASQQAEESAMRRKALEALEFVGLRGKEFAEARSLPYGRQRLLELARALVSEPKLLLLDEPAAGLNAAETEVLVDLLFQICDRGITILLVEHDMSLVMNVSDHITVLNFGKKIAEGSAEAIEKNQEVIDAYLGTEVGNA